MKQSSVALLFYIKDIIRLIVDIVRDLRTLVIAYRKSNSGYRCQQSSNIVETVIAFHPFRIVLDIERATSIELLVIADGNATNRLLYAYSLAHKISKTSVYNNNR